MDLKSALLYKNATIARTAWNGQYTFDTSKNDSELIFHSEDILADDWFVVGKETAKEDNAKIIISEEEYKNKIFNHVLEKQENKTMDFKEVLLIVGVSAKIANIIFPKNDMKGDC